MYRVIQADKKTKSEKLSQSVTLFKVSLAFGTYSKWGHKSSLLNVS